MSGLIAAPGTFTGACPRRPCLLALFDQGEQAAQALVLDHGRLGDEEGQFWITMQLADAPASR
jgi:hypothetical protein